MPGEKFAARREIEISNPDLRNSPILFCQREVKFHVELHNARLILIGIFADRSFG